MEVTPKAFILRLRLVPMIDAAGLHAIDTVCERLKKRGSTLILSGVNKDVNKYIHKAGLHKKVGEDNICNHIDKALSRAFIWLIVLQNLTHKTSRPSDKQFFFIY